MNDGELQLPAIPGSDAKGGDAARAALDDAARETTDTTDADDEAGGGQTEHPAPLAATGGPGPRDKGSAAPPVVVASVPPIGKKLSKRALAGLSKRALVAEVVTRDAELATLAAKVESLESRSAAVSTLAPDHHVGLAREAIVTVQGLAVVLTQDGRYQLNQKQIDRLATAWGAVVQREVPAALASSPWGGAIMATLGVVSEKWLEVRETNKAASAPSTPAATPTA